MTLNEIKLFLTDIDGVWTDGGMYYSNDGLEFKKFNTSDSAGILFCRLLDIKTGIITGESSPAVKNRSEKLKVDFCHLGIKDKLEVANKIIKNLNIDWKEVAYIGDDINDIQLLKKVGLSATTGNAPVYIKNIVDIVLSKNGGEGVFREFVEYYLNETNQMNKALNLYIKGLNFQQ